MYILFLDVADRICEKFQNIISELSCSLNRFGLACTMGLPKLLTIPTIKDAAVVEANSIIDIVRRPILKNEYHSSIFQYCVSVFGCVFVLVLYVPVNNL